MAPNDILEALKNSNSWLFFFQVCFSHWTTLGHPLLAFLETGIITRFVFFFSPAPRPPFHVVIGSLFNLVKKIGLAWERRNSFGDRFCCFRVVRVVFAAQEEKVPVCAKTS